MYENCNSDFEIVHQNIRSIRANFDLFVTELSARSKLPQIIILTEIWISSYESKLYELPNYTLFINSSEETRAGGVAVYISSCLSVRDCVSVKFTSADVILVTCNLLKSIIHFLAIYRFHAYSIEYFTDELEIWLRDNHSLKNLAIIGDININIMDENSHAVDLYKVLLASNGLESLVNEPTRIVSNTCIDHFYVRVENKSKIHILAKVEHLYITDHSMIRVCIANNDFSKEGVFQTRYRVDYDQLKISLDSLDWSPVYSQLNASEAFDHFHYLLTTEISNNSNEILQRNCTQKLKPWVTSFICKKIKFRKTLYARMKKNPNDNRCQIQFKEYSKKLKKIVKETKRDFYISKFIEQKGNSKQIWKTINELTGQKKQINKIISLDIDGKLEENDHTLIANTFNNYYMNVVENLVVSERRPQNIEEFEESARFPISSERSSMFLSPIVEKDIEIELKSLRAGKSPGVDKIGTYLVRRIFSSISDVLLIFLT